MINIWTKFILIIKNVNLLRFFLINRISVNFLINVYKYNYNELKYVESVIFKSITTFKLVIIWKTEVKNDAFKWFKNNLKLNKKSSFKESVIESI